MKKAGCLFLVNLLIMFMCFGTVLAENVIKSENQAEYEVFDLGEIYITAEKLPAVRDVAITTEITAEDIKATNSRTVAEALSYVPGIRVSTGRKNEPNVQIHGFDQSRTLILIDGVPYYETNFGKLDLSQIPVNNVAKIEITKGGASVLYGPNALAGIINIITKKPSDRPSAEAIIEVGENATSKVSLSHGMKVGIFNYRLNYAHQEFNGWRMSDNFEPKLGKIIRKPGGTSQAILEDGGFRNNSGFKSNSFWAKAGIESSAGSEYYINFHYLTREKGFPPSTDEVQVFTSRPAFSQFARITRYDDWGIDLSGQQKIVEQLIMKAKLFYHNHIDDYTSYSDQTFNEEIAVSRYKDYLLGGALTTDFKPAQWDVIRLAFNYRGDSHKERDDTYLPFAESFSYTGSVGFENEFTLIKNLSLVAGVSYDWFRVSEAKRNITDNNTGYFIRQDDLKTPDTMDEFSPMIGATYNITESIRLFGSIARKVRFPTLQQLYSTKGGNVDLDAERSTNYILGISHAFKEFAKAELSFFNYDISDFITRNAPGLLGGTYQNFGKIQIYGLELNGTISIMKDLSLTAAYTYDHARDRSNDRVTDKVVNVPEHKIDVGINYMIPYILTRLDLTNTYVSGGYSQLPTPQKPAQKEIKTGDYLIVNARISKSFLKNHEAYVAINNIFDSDYESETGFPGPGRNFYVGLAVRY